MKPAPPMELANMVSDNNTAIPVNDNAAAPTEAAPPRARPVAVEHERRAGHRLGPLVAIVPMNRPVIGRFWAASVTLAVAALFVLAADLVPDGRRLGTHRQLGLPQCGFEVMTGLPCPTCGMTTAFAYTVRGRFIEAIHAQLAGFVLAIGVACAGIVTLLATVTGKLPAINWYRIAPTRVLWISMILFMTAWGINIVLTLIERSWSTG